MHEIYFAAGSFWGVQKYFDLIDGIVDTMTCYINGNKENPKYRDVCNGSGHAEAVKVVYNTSILSLDKLLDYYYDIVNPTVYIQGKEGKKQYRAGIYYEDKKDAETIINSLDNLQDMYLEPIVIEVEKVKNVTMAEEYHQKFLLKYPFGYCNIDKCFLKKIEKENLKISDLAYDVIKGKTDEPAFKNEYYNNFLPGIYVDIKTGTPLFSSKDKYDSGSGWPSFTKPILDNLLLYKTELNHFMFRTEIKAKDSGNHLGYVFNDGPKDHGGKRYLVNSAAVRFIPREKMWFLGYKDYIKYL